MFYPHLPQRGNDTLSGWGANGGFLRYFWGRAVQGSSATHRPFPAGPGFGNPDLLNYLDVNGHGFSFLWSPGHVLNRLATPVQIRKAVPIFPLVVEFLKQDHFYVPLPQSPCLVVYIERDLTQVLSGMN